MEFLEKYALHEDARGSFLGIINKYTWGEINFVHTKAGVVRGKHYHRYTKELFYILSGEIQIDVMNIVDRAEHHFVAKPHMAFIIDPYEVHTFTTNEESTWLNMLSHRMDERNPDFFRLEEGK
jgi:UDP-2-acetamido-2,6-beta-L-arabino-hexul-4-ose reductase